MLNPFLQYSWIHSLSRKGAFYFEAAGAFSKWYVYQQPTHLPRRPIFQSICKEATFRKDEQNTSYSFSTTSSSYFDFSVSCHKTSEGHWRRRQRRLHWITCFYRKTYEIMEFLKDVKDQDLYKLFEIERGADASEIKKAQCGNLKNFLFKDFFMWNQIPEKNQFHE